MSLTRVCARARNAYNDRSVSLCVPIFSNRLLFSIKTIACNRDTLMDTEGVSVSLFHSDQSSFWSYARRCRTWTKRHPRVLIDL
jgi:hypothetical protein